MAQNEELTEGQVPSTYTTESAPVAEATEASPRNLTVAGSAVGRRKRAIARVRVVPGSGKWTLNGRELAEYFPNKLHQQEVNDPKALTM